MSLTEASSPPLKNSDEAGRGDDEGESGLGIGDDGDGLPSHTPAHPHSRRDVTDQAVQVDIRDVLASSGDDAAIQLPVPGPPAEGYGYLTGVDGGALPSLEECCILRAVHNRVRQFTALMQLWLEDPRAFNFVGEWVGPYHPEPTAAAFRAQRDDEELLLQAIRVELQRTIADPTVPKEEKVEQMKTMSDRQKMIFVRRAERLEQSRKELRDFHERAFRTMNERSIEDDTDENNIMVGPTALGHSCIAHLGKLFLFLRAAVQGNVLPSGADCSTIFPGGERQRTVYGLSQGLHSALDKVVFPRDFEELKTIVKGGELPDLYRIKYTTPWNFGTDELEKLRDKFLKQYAAEEYRKVQAMAKKKKEETISALDKELAKIRSAAVLQHQQLEASLAASTSQRRATSAGSSTTAATAGKSSVDATPPSPPPLMPPSSAPPHIASPSVDAAAVNAVVVVPAAAGLSRPTSTTGKPPMSPAVMSTSPMPSHPLRSEVDPSAGGDRSHHPHGGPPMLSLAPTAQSACEAGAPPLSAQPSLRGPQPTLPPLPSSDDIKLDSQTTSARDSIATTVGDEASSRMLKTVVGSAISPVDGPLDPTAAASRRQSTREPRCHSIGSMSDVEGSAITAWQAEYPPPVSLSGSSSIAKRGPDDVAADAGVNSEGHLPSTTNPQTNFSSSVVGRRASMTHQRRESTVSRPPPTAIAASPLALDGAPKQYHGNMYAQLRNAVQRERQTQQQPVGGGNRGPNGAVHKHAKQQLSLLQTQGPPTTDDPVGGTPSVEQDVSKDVSRMAATATLLHAHEQLHTVSDAFTEQRQQKKRGGTSRLLSSSLRGTIASAPTSLASEVQDEHLDRGRFLFGERSGKKLYTATTHRNSDGRVDVEVIPTTAEDGASDEGDARRVQHHGGQHRGAQDRLCGASSSLPHRTKPPHAGPAAVSGRGNASSLAAELAGGGALASLAAKVKHQRDLISNDTQPRSTTMATTTMAPTATATAPPLQPLGRDSAGTRSAPPPPTACGLDFRKTGPLRAAGAADDDALAAHAVATSASEQLMVEAMLQNRLQRNQLQLLRVGGASPVCCDAVNDVAASSTALGQHNRRQENEATCATAVALTPTAATDVPTSCLFGPRAADVPSLIPGTLRRAATPTTQALSHRGASALRATMLIGDPTVATPASTRNAFAAQPLVHHHNRGASGGGGASCPPDANPATTTIYSAATLSHNEERYQQQQYRSGGHQKAPHSNAAGSGGGGGPEPPYTFATHVELLRSGVRPDHGGSRLDAFPAGQPLRRGDLVALTGSNTPPPPWDVSEIEMARREELSGLMLSDDVHTAVAVDGASLRIAVAKPRFSYIL